MTPLSYRRDTGRKGTKMETMKIGKYSFRVSEGRALNIALCEGRHEIPAAVDGAIYPFEVNPFDYEGLRSVAANRLDGFGHGNGVVNLYVTGMTSAALAVASICFENEINLIAWHYNRDTGEYAPQVVYAVDPCPFCGRPFGNGTHCSHCGAT